MRTMLLLAAGAIWLGLSAFVAKAEDLSAEIEAARQVYLEGVSGDKAATEDAARRFEALLGQNPGNPLILAYLGSSETLLGKQAWMPWNKMNHAEKGLGLLDTALESLTAEHAGVRSRGIPVGLEVRLTAGATFVRVPRFFHRFDKGKALLDALVADPLLAEAPAAFQASALFWAAQAAQEDGDEARRKTLLSKAVALDPEGPEGRKAKQELSAGE